MTDSELIIAEVRDTLTAAYNCPIDHANYLAPLIASHDGQARPSTKLAVVDGVVRVVVGASDASGREPGTIEANMMGDNIPQPLSRFVHEFIYWNAATPGIRWTLRPLVCP